MRPSSFAASYPSYASHRDAPHASPSRPAVIDSERLFQDSKLIHIEHHGQVYALRETRLGKLILTK